MTRCTFASSGCNHPESECMGLCTLTRRVRAGGPPPEEPIEFHPEEIRRDGQEAAAKIAAGIVILLLVMGFIHFIAKVLPCSN